ncbi:MAG: Structural maintenance of chromosomes protein 5 [Bathelium mastoideum]|nr:MAG: Structural maintenance of chromosomes protein 5 [Bathelium mastoideum]
MPGRVVPQRRSRSEGVDSEIEGDVLSDSSSNTSKRARLSNSVAPRPRTNGVHAYTNGANTASGDEDHQPGSIVRVRLKNFVTYTATEFHPGPSLNMVIGPNGTGKSTLVCAICLGLGWGPQHLGRAKELSEFVKHGAREAEIEIELKAGEKQRGKNPIIKRHIKREGNKTTWFINGNSSSHKVVQQLARSFSIQVDNLCQFLPQDRVVEFAALSPVQLLDQTQRAAAPEYMVQWHDELKRLRDEQKKSQTEQNTIQSNLANLEDRQKAQQLDYDRLQEREVVKSRVAALEKVRPIAQCRTALAKCQGLKEEKRAAQQSLKQLTRELEPSFRAASGKQAYKDQVKSVIDTRKRQVDRHEKRVEDLQKQLKDLQTKMDDCGKKKKAEKDGDQDRKVRVERSKREIGSIKARMERTPPEFDAPLYNEKIRAQSRRMRDLQSRKSEIQDSIVRYVNEITKLREKATTKQKQIEHLQSQAGQQFTKLQQLSRDTSRLWDYVRTNQNKFQSKVYGPAVVECSLKDTHFANSIESVFQPGELKALICTNQADYKQLTDIATKQLGLADFHVRQIFVGLDHWKPPVSEEEMKQLGLDGWLLDFIQGPEPVLSSLCENARFHQTGLAMRELTEQQFENLSASAVSSFVDQSKSYQITRRREYGPKATSTRVRDIRPARIWTNQRGDSHIEEELGREIREANGEIEEYEIQKDRDNRELKSLQGEYNDAKSEKEQLEKDKDTMQKADLDFKTLPTKLEAEETKLVNLQQEGADLRSRLLAFDREAEEYAYQRSEKAIDYARAIELFRTQVSDLITAELIHLEASADLSVLKARNAEVEKLLKERKEEVEHKEFEYRRMLEEKNSWQRKCEALFPNGRTDEEEQAVQDTEGMSPQDLEVEIESAQSRLALLHEGNPRAIQEFERRAQEIERLKEKVQTSTAALASFEGQIQQVRERWEPELDELIAKISEAFGKSFERIGCAGQVGIHKDDDFENWAVQIMVRFRENETLTQLDAQRQSGGERAVSTIFYLMALQSLARAPFRVVDEINQGMDPRNERIVHERMVDIACGAVPTAAPPVVRVPPRGLAAAVAGRSQTAELYGMGDSEADGGDTDEVDSVLGPRSDTGRSSRRATTAPEDGEVGGGRTSQYFLITPKLLSGLKYRPGMKVHCIASGEYMPEEWKKLDFGRILAHAKVVIGRNRPSLGTGSLGGRLSSVGP